MSARAPAARIAEWLLRLGLGGLFLYAGVMKLRDPSAFATEVSNYHFLPSLAPLLGAVLPPVEVVLGLAAIALPAPWRRAAALGLAGLCVVFTVAVAQVVARGINIDCGCFGGSAGPVNGLTVVRDVALIAAAVALYALTPSDRPLAPRR